ncbi:MAG: hypothetical protein ABW215_20650 [Kibdelosporangium sp.]
MRAWVRSGGGQNDAYIALRDCGGSEQRANLPIDPDGLWIRLAVSVDVTGQQCTISLVSDAKAGNWANFEDVQFAAGHVALPVRGGDVSSLRKGEAKGATYRTGLARPHGRRADESRVRPHI